MFTAKEWAEREAQTARRIAAREKAQAKARILAERVGPCRVCGGRMSAPRNGVSTCQGSDGIRCGVSIVIDQT